MQIENANDFYDALAPLFDVLTDWDARLGLEGPALQRLLSDAGARRVLDAACGSGGHTLALVDWGFDVVGADASPMMIRLAKQKAQAAGANVPFVQSDLASLQANLADHTPFDAVLCLGNSLPHLLSMEELLDALTGMWNVLRPGGLLVLQNLNYDLRWQRQPRFFAAQGGTYEGREVLVWRFADYDLSAGRIAFHFALFRKGDAGWQVEVHTTPHRPVFQQELLLCLEQTGFAPVGSYGQLTEPLVPFLPLESPDLVVVAHKPV